MAKPTTHVLIVTDMSGSMTSLADEVRSGFNGYIDDLIKSKGEKDLRYRVTSTVFNTKFIPLCVDAKLSNVPRLTHDNYSPSGMTALFDAVAKTVLEFEDKTNLSKDDKVILLVQTDGLENSSNEYNLAQLQEMLDSRAKNGKWAIIYMGQGIQAWNKEDILGKFSLGVNTGTSRSATKSRYRGMAAATSAYASSGDANEAATILRSTKGIMDNEDGK
jgi:hypothetical protein